MPKLHLWKFWYKDKIYAKWQWTSDTNTRIMKNKAMAQEIWKISILYPKTSKEFYHHIRFLKSITNGMCSIQKAVLKDFSIFTGKRLCWCLFLIKVIQKNLQHRCFPCEMIMARFLQNNSERLFERFPTGTNNSSNKPHRKWIKHFLKHKRKKSF